MPFRRTHRRRRRRRRRPTAMRAVKRLARFVDTELHQSVVASAAQQATSLGLFIRLVQIDQGDDDTDRSGVQVALRSLEVRFHMERGNTDACVRTIIFVDKQTNGIQPTLADIFQVLGSPEIGITSPINNDNKRRFTILSDRLRNFIDGHSDHQCWRYGRKLTNKVRFDGTSSALVDVVSGMVWCLHLADVVAGAPAVDVNQVSRVWFAP